MSDITYYQDIIVRDYLEEGLGINKQISAASPDIIPYGQDILSLETATDQYNRVLYDYKHSVVSNQQCNCYVRAKNISNGRESKGSVRLFLMPFNVFTNPQQWYALKAYNSDTGKEETEVSLVGKREGRLTTQIAQGQVCINKSAFLLSDEYGLQQGEHYCLCAVLETPYHKVSIPQDFKNNLEVDRWIINNPNVALLNIRPIALNAQFIDYSFKFGNFNQVSADFVLKISFLAEYEKGERWPSDTVVRIQCTDSRYSFDENQLAIPAYNPTRGAPSITISLDNVPANFYGLCSVYLTSKSETPAHAAIKGEYMAIMDGVPKEYEDIRDHFVPAPELAKKRGKAAYLVRLGECYAYNKQMSAHKLYEMIEAM